MRRLTGMACGLLLLLQAACAAPGTLTLIIHEDERRVVRLHTLPDGHDGKPFSHPAVLTEDDVAGVLRGLYVETRETPFSRLFSGGAARQRRPAFSRQEIAFFAPLFVRGLRRARPDEVVTFYETVEVSDMHAVTTSGGLFLQGNVMHILLSNDRVRTDIWQDNEQYRAPVRTRPLEPIAPEPGRLVFEPAALMVRPNEDVLTTLLRGTPWHVGVRFQELP